MSEDIEYRAAASVPDVIYMNQRIKKLESAMASVALRVAQ